jgi:hypothetical protein
MVSRRGLLRLGGVIGGVSTAGYVGSGVLDCSASHVAVVETVPVSRAAVERTDGEPVVVAELPDGECRIARTAIDEGTYRDCPAADPIISESIRSVAARAAAHRGEDGRGPVHLDDDGQYDAVGVSIEDQVAVSLPDEDVTSAG